MTASPRIVGIDVARSIAIFLAMGSHVWATARVGGFFEGPTVDVLRLLMALATPTFIILFGTMLELVYLPRFVPGKRRGISSRLLSRAIQCWLLYSLSVLVLFFTRPDYSFLFSLSTILMLGVTPFTDILKFYAIVLALAPLLLLLRIRFGVVPLLIPAIAVHLLHPVLRALPSPESYGLPKALDRLAMFVSGIGDAQLGGPSVLHGATLVIFGMILGRVLTGDGSETSDPTAKLLRRARWMFISSAFVLLLAVLLVGDETLHELGNMAMRMDSHPLYFIFGILGAYTLTAASILLTPASKTSEKFAFLGRTSLFVFAFGNMLLYAVLFDVTTKAQSVCLAIVLIVLITALSFWFDRASKRDGAVARLVLTIRGHIDHVARMVVERVPILFKGHEAPRRNP